jgi:RHS repeat-associated protein
MRYIAAVELYMTPNRPYDPSTGDWLQPDPAGFDAGQTNLFEYCGNSATNATDPSGLMANFSQGSAANWGPLKGTDIGGVGNCGCAKGDQIGLLSIGGWSGGGGGTVIPILEPADNKAPDKKPAAGWSQQGVQQLLSQSTIGTKTIDTLKNKAAVYQSEYVRAQKKVKSTQTGQWSDWQAKDWGAMTVNGKDVHIPANYTNEQAAYILVHEGTHVQGGDEIAAYTAETQFAVECPAVRALIRPGFTSKVNGKEVVNDAAIKKFVDDHYKGWYQPDPNVQYKKIGDRIQIDYGNETIISGWGEKK